MGRLLQQIVEVVCRPLYERRQLGSLFLFDNVRIEGNVILLERGGLVNVQQGLDGEGPSIEADEGAKERLIDQEG